MGLDGEATFVDHRLHRAGEKLDLLLLEQRRRKGFCATVFGDFGDILVSVGTALANLQLWVDRNPDFSRLLDNFPKAKP